MSNELSKIKHELPTLQELNLDVEAAFKNDQFKLLLNQEPVKKWLKPHPMATKKVVIPNADGKTFTKKEVPAEYLPIDKVEFLLDKIFQNWKIEILREGVMFNSVYVTVRVHYQNPVDKEWYYHDGVGAAPVQKDKDTVLSVETIKSAAIAIALPSAKSYAIKDACDHLGKLFGRDTNRQDTISFQGAYEKPQPPDSEIKEGQRILQLIVNAKSRADLTKIKKDCTSIEASDAFDKAWAGLK